MFSIGGTDDLTLGGPGCTGEALQFHTGDNVGENAIAIFRQHPPVDATEPRGQNDGPHL